MTDDELDPEQRPNKDDTPPEMVIQRLHQALARNQETHARFMRQFDLWSQRKQIDAALEDMRIRNERWQNPTSKLSDLPSYLAPPIDHHEMTSHPTFDEAFKFKRRNPKGRPKFSAIFADHISQLPENRFPQLSRRLTKTLKDESAQALVLILSALIDQGLRNVLFYVLCIEIGCDTDVTRKHMEDYRVSTETFFKDCKKALMATNRQVKTKEGACDLTYYFEQCFDEIIGGDSDEFRQARLIRHRIAHGNRVGGNKKSGDVWQRISTDTDTICYQAAIAMLNKIKEIDGSFVTCFGQKNITFKPFDGNLQGFTSRTSKMTPAQTKVLLSMLI